MRGRVGGTGQAVLVVGGSTGGALVVAGLTAGVGGVVVLVGCAVAQIAAVDHLESRGHTSRTRLTIITTVARFVTCRASYKGVLPKPSLARARVAAQDAVHAGVTGGAVGR